MSFTQKYARPLLFILIIIGSTLAMIFLAKHYLADSSFASAWVLVIVAFLGLVCTRLFTSLRTRKRKPSHAGERECPHCSSFQTDQVTEPQADGTEVTTWVCFKCDSRF